MQAVVYGRKLNLLNFSSRAGKASIILFSVLNYTIFLCLNHLRNDKLFNFYPMDMSVIQKNSGNSWYLGRQQA
jgi:hypothetical protein